MNKEDKQFFTGLIGGLKTDLENQIGSVKTDLEDQIRHNGVLIEEIQSDFRAFGERQDSMDNRLRKVEANVKEIKDNTHDLPVIRQTVAGHSTAIFELSK